jgi:hypothetical protein
MELQNRKFKQFKYVYILIFMFQYKSLECTSA